MEFVKVKDRILAGEYKEDAPELYKLKRGRFFDLTNKKIICGMQVTDCKYMPDLDDAVKLEYIGTTEACEEHLYRDPNKGFMIYGYDFYSVLSYDRTHSPYYFENDDILVCSYYGKLWYLKDFIIVPLFGIINKLTGEVYEMVGVSDSIIRQAISKNLVKELNRLVKASGVVPYISRALCSERAKLRNLIKYMYKYGARPLLMGMSDAVYRFKMALDLARSNDVLPEYHIKDPLVVNDIYYDKESVQVDLRCCLLTYRYKLNYYRYDGYHDRRLKVRDYCEFFSENSLCGIMDEAREEEIIKRWAVFLRKAGLDKVWTDIEGL